MSSAFCHRSSMAEARSGVAFSGRSRRFHDKAL
jgi:hypothetical protein